MKTYFIQGQTPDPTPATRRVLGSFRIDSLVNCRESYARRGLGNDESIPIPPRMLSKTLVAVFPSSARLGQDRSPQLDPKIASCPVPHGVGPSSGDPAGAGASASTPPSSPVRENNIAGMSRDKENRASETTDTFRALGAPHLPCRNTSGSRACL